MSEDDSPVKSLRSHPLVIPATWSKSSSRSSVEYGCEGNSAGIQRPGCLREDHPHQQKDLKSAQLARSQAVLSSKSIRVR